MTGPAALGRLAASWGEGHVTIDEHAAAERPERTPGPRAAALGAVAYAVDCVSITSDGVSY